MSSYPQITLEWDEVVRAVVDFSSSVSKSVSELGSEATSLISDIISRTTDSASLAPPPASSLGFSFEFDKVYDFLEANKKVLTCCAVGTACLAFYTLLRTPRRKGYGRHCAPRTPDGGRTEVVVIAGKPEEPLVRFLARDLVSRGFLVILCSQHENIDTIFGRKPDGVFALKVEFADSNSVYRSANAISAWLRCSSKSPLKSTSTKLHLAGIMIIPSLSYPFAPLEAISVELCQEQLFKLLMPLSLLSSGYTELARNHRSRFILVTPGMISTLRPAFHSIESLVVAGLEALALSIHRELKPQHIHFTHIKLGAFRHGSQRENELQILRNVRADVVSWPETLRRIYGRSFGASVYLQINRTRGPSLLLLSERVFDALALKNAPRVVHIGKGSYVYELLTAALPESWISRLLNAV